MATISYGTFTITNELDGSQFWTTTVEPVAPDYTFTISNLVGDTNADIKIGDIILYSHYRYTVTVINNNGTTVRGSNRESLKGVDGISPTVKSIACSHAAVVCEKNGEYNPERIQFNGQAIFENTVSDYQGWFVIELSSDATSWVSSYSSASKESFVNYTIPLGINISKNGILYHQGSSVTTNGSIVNANFVISSEGIISTTQDIGFIIRSIRCSLYSDANKTDLIDQQRINIAFDGVDGDKGDDGYTVILTNENHTFSGTSTSAVDSYAECDVIAYIGDTQTTCRIGTINGCPTGMSTTIYNNDTNTAKFRVTVTPAMTSQNGVLDVPVTVNDGSPNGKLFNMKFTYSLKLNGLDATGLGWKVNYSTPTTPNDGECIYHGFDKATKQPSFNTDGWVLWNGEEITIPHGCYINPNNTMPYNTTIYSVYRLPNATTYTGGTFHDVAWIESANTWRSNTYSGTLPTIDSLPWIWNEDTDIILSMYVEPFEEGAITNAQLFTPPKKYSELVEVAKGMAKNAEKMAINYMSSDVNGIMMADLRNGYHLPSDPVGQNVLIDNTKIDVRNGQTSLATFGATTRIGTTTGRNVTIDSDSVDIMSGDSSLASFSYDVRVGRDTLPHMVVAPTSITAYKGNNDLYFQVGDGSLVAYQTYNVDAVSVDITLSNPIYDITSVKVNNNTVTDYTFNSGESLLRLNDRPVQAITVTVNYSYAVETIIDTGEEDKEKEIKIEVIGATQTFTFPKLVLTIPLEYSSDNIQSVIPSGYTISNDSVVYDPRPEKGTIVTIEYYLSGSQPYFTFNNRGNGNKGSGSVSFSNGGVANGESSFITGIGGTATGKASFSNGIDSSSLAEAGSAMGKGITNMAVGGLAIGSYNLSSDNTLFTIGNGTSSNNKSNAFTVLSNGTTVVGGRLMVGNYRSSKPLFKIITKEIDNIGIGIYGAAYPSLTISESGYTPVAISNIALSNASSGGYACTWCICQSVNLSGNSINCYVGNWSKDTGAKIKLTFKILCIASNAL